MKKKHSKNWKILLVILTIILIFIFAGWALAYHYVGDIETTKITKSDEELGVDSELSDKKIVNIALFGIDEGVTGQPEGVRSDAMVILTLDKNDNAVKLTSLLRDSQVEVEGYGNQNLNQAYKFGGPELAIKTINQNYDMDIKDYVTVNFSQLKEIVDAVGGVNIETRPEELSEINAGSPNSQYLEAAGETTLTGEQALAYSRIRTAGTDVARSHRQQYVLNAIFQKLKAMPKSDYPSVIKKFMPMVETSLSYNELIALVPFVAKDFTVEQNIIPLKKYETDLWGGMITPSCWSWTYDLDNAANRLHHIIYNTPYEAPEATEATGENSEIFNQMYDEDAN